MGVAFVEKGCYNKQEIRNEQSAKDRRAKGGIEIMTKKKQWFGNHISPNCSYCAYGDGETRPECTLHLFLDIDGSCPKFFYDPLKRTPNPEYDMKVFDFKPEDFQL